MKISCCWPWLTVWFHLEYLIKLNCLRVHWIAFIIYRCSCVQCKYLIPIKIKNWIDFEKRRAAEDKRLIGSRFSRTVLSSGSQKAQQLFQFFIHLMLKHLSNCFRREANRVMFYGNPHTLCVIKLSRIDTAKKRNELFMRDNRGN